tara:strand:+ start:315 stop:563 length:249 start_codon:yes stop_codon:yes gene_type:complete
MDKRYIVYGLEECSFCVSAQEILKGRNLQFSFFELSADPEFLAEVKGFYDFLTVPIILENNIITGFVSFIGGYSDLVEHLGG